MLREGDELAAQLDRMLAEDAAAELAAKSGSTAGTTAMATPATAIAPTPAPVVSTPARRPVFPAYRFPDEGGGFGVAADAFRKMSRSDLIGEMRRLTAHGARRGDIGLYATIRPQAAALACVMNERGIETPFTRLYFITSTQGTVAARDLSNDRHVIDLHWLATWADDAHSRWADIYGAAFSFAAASNYASSEIKAHKKVLQLGLTRQEQLEPAYLRDQQVRDRQRKLAKIFQVMDKGLREAKRKTGAGWVRVERATAIAKAMLLKETLSPRDLLASARRFCPDTHETDIERYTSWLREHGFAWLKSGIT